MVVTSNCVPFHSRQRPGGFADEQRHSLSEEYLVGFTVLELLCHIVPTATIFTLKNPAEESMEGDRDEEEDDFQTDEEEGMEVDKQVLQKRKKVCGNWIFFFLSIFGASMWWTGIDEIMPVSLNDAIAVIFMSFRSRVVVFRRNSEITTGNQGARNVEKCEVKYKTICVFLYLVICQGSNTVLPVWSSITVSKPAWCSYKLNSFNLSYFPHMKGCLFFPNWSVSQFQRGGFLHFLVSNQKF